MSNLISRAERDLVITGETFYINKPIRFAKGFNVLIRNCTFVITEDFSGGAFFEFDFLPDKAAVFSNVIVHNRQVIDPRLFPSRQEVHGESAGQLKIVNNKLI